MTKRALLRPLRGSEVTLQQFQTYILGLLQQHDRLKSHEIANLVGPPYQEDGPERIDLLQIISRMKSRGTIVKEAGFFRLGRNAATIGVSKQDAYERLILKYMREEGGIVRRAALFYDLLNPGGESHRFRKIKRRFRSRLFKGFQAPTPSEAQQNDSESYMLKGALERLERDGRVRRDFSLIEIHARGQEYILNLAPEDLAQCPQTLWGYRVILKCAGIKGSEFDRMMDQWCEGAGRAVRVTRETIGITREEVLQDPEVRRRFRDLARWSEADRHQIIDEWYAGQEDDWTGEVPEGFLLVEVLRRFEECEGSRGWRGSRLTHWNATGPLWWALGKRLGVEGYGMSRGVPEVQHAVDGVVVGRRDYPDLGDQMEPEEEAERWEAIPQWWRWEIEPPIREEASEVAQVLPEDDSGQES